MKRFRCKKSVFVIGILILLLLFIKNLYNSKYAFTVTTYHLPTTNISTSLRILQLTDLHNSEFGTHNSRLINSVRAQSPDLILLTGDLEYQENYGVDVDELYRKAGAVVLEKQYQDITVNDQKVRLGGIYGYCLPGKYLETGEADQEECTFLEEFQNTDLPTILMCHMPVCWMINGSLDAWDVDYVFSGHVHGGEVILPFIGGLYGPDLGWFPGRMEGIFTSENKEKTLILSRGLGTSERIPRFNNIPEIMVVDIQGKD